MLQVTRALRAFDKLEALASLAVVDEDAAAYDATLHDRLFVAETAESMLRNAGVKDRQLIRACALCFFFAFYHTYSIRFAINHEWLFVADISSTLANVSLGGTQLKSQHYFQIGTYGVHITESGTVMCAEGGSCLLGPVLQSGQVYYLKFEVLAWPGGQLMFGVTTNSDPAGSWLKTDGGWFIQDLRGRGCKLTGTKLTFDPTWSSWRTGDCPLFKVDLVANTVTVQLSRGGQIVREACLKVAPYGAAFFAVTMSHLGRVKVLPVMLNEISGF